MKGQINCLKQCKSRHKNYGFIAGEDGKMYFFIPSDLVNAKVGDSVSFRGAKDEKGYFAEGVTFA